MEDMTNSHFLGKHPLKNNFIETQIILKSTHRLMHFALVNILTITILIDMKTKITETSEARIQVLACSMCTYAWRLLALVYVRSVVVFAPSIRAEDFKFFRVVSGTGFAGHTPA